MPQLTGLGTRTAGTKITAASFNTDFGTIQTWANSSVVLTDTARTVTATHVYSASQSFNAGATFGAVVTVSSGGITVTTGGLRVNAGGITVTGASSVAGALTVSTGGIIVTGNSTITGNLNVTGSITGGTITVPAASVTAGTFGAGNFVFQGNITTSTGTISGGSVLATSGQLRAARTTIEGQPTSVSFSASNHHRVTLTAATTLALSGGVVGGVYTVEVLQNVVGGYTYSFTNVVWSDGIAPAITTTANRKDMYTFFYDGTSYLGAQFGKNFNSLG